MALKGLEKIPTFTFSNFLPITFSTYHIDFKWLLGRKLEFKSLQIIFHSENKLEFVRPILPIMCEIAQWALFNKMPENDVNSLKFPQIWSSICHLLKNQCFQDVYSNKDLFNEVKKCLISTLEYHFINYNDFCWKMLKEMNQVLKDCIRNHISKVQTNYR